MRIMYAVLFVSLFAVMIVLAYGKKGKLAVAVTHFPVVAMSRELVLPLNPDGSARVPSGADIRFTFRDLGKDPSDVTWSFGKFRGFEAGRPGYDPVELPVGKTTAEGRGTYRPADGTYMVVGSFPYDDVVGMENAKTAETIPFEFTVGPSE